MEEETQVISEVSVTKGVEQNDSNTDHIKVSLSVRSLFVSYLLHELLK